MKASSDFTQSELTVPALDGAARDKLKVLGTIVAPLSTSCDVSKLGQDLIDIVAPFKSNSESQIDDEFHSKLRVVYGSKSMTALIGDGTPVANVRQGEDQGLVDFYNVDNYIPEAGQLKRDLLAMGLKEFLEEMSGESLYLKSMNAYINLGVTNTRGFHADSFGVRQYKAFVYLTEVSNFSDGPYCYVPGSQNDSNMERVNRYLGRKFGSDPTDLLLFDFRSAMPIFGPAGSLIVSDQSGAHRGFPQSPEGKRAVAVFNFFQKG